MTAFCRVPLPLAKGSFENLLAAMRSRGWRCRLQRAAFGFATLRDYSVAERRLKSESTRNECSYACRLE